MGPYTYQSYSPFSFKPTGFIAGAGHSATFAGNDGRLWHITTLSISKRHGYDLRVFGNAEGKPAPPVTSWTARRDPADARHATVDWQPVDLADFYIVRIGTTPTALTQNFQVYSATTLDIRSLNSGQPYFLTIDSVSENGVTRGGPAVPIANP